MKILFVNDFFPPFTKGGGEVSAYYQVKEVLSSGAEVCTLSPKYKDDKKVLSTLFKQYWYKLPFKVSQASPLLFLNPLFFFYLFSNLFLVWRKEKPDIIHCQGKYSSPAVFFFSFIFNIPWVLTLRDLKGICNHGFCLYKGVKGCNIFSFFKKDFLVYFKNYVKDKNVITFLVQLFFSFLGRLNTFVLAFFMRRAAKFVCVSGFVKKVYKANGFNGNKMEVIYNPPPKIKLEKVLLPKKLEKRLSGFKYLVLYAGKLSLGKGADLLIKAGKNIIKKRKDVLFIFAGKIHHPVKGLVEGVKNNNQFLFLGRVEQSVLFSLMKKIDLVCLPSVWPEPLSRVTLEAFYFKKPVLSTDVGGQKELVSEKTGWLVKPEVESLERGLETGLKSKSKLNKKGKSACLFLQSFSQKQVDKLLKVYNSLL
jgi:glycosyltransferase involved in cell wall biosynthesis